jgi:signal transduction histidine kinase
MTPKLELVTSAARPLLESSTHPVADAGAEETAAHATLPLAPRRTHDPAIQARVLEAEGSAMERLAAGAAYELETPVSRIGACLRAALESSEALGDDLRLDLQDALDAVEQIDHTVRGLRAFTAVADAAHGVDVHEALELAMHFAGREVSARAVLRRRYSPVPLARGSLSRVARVLLAVLRNAAGAIPAGMPWANSITVETALGADDGVVVEVADTGVGIEPGDLDYVFDPFFTTRPTPTAQGLGLSAARASVTDMGGTLTVESTLGRGSRFRITLPSLHDGQVCSIRLLSPDVPPTRRVLCVGDSIAEARRVRDLVDDGDAQFALATCGDALERLALGDAFDLVLCDAGAAARSSFRRNLARVAPQALGHVFEVAGPARAAATAAT